jgi:molybdopterin biosynthesis enzyme
MPEFLRLLPPGVALERLLENLPQPAFYQSNLIFSLVRADGLVCVPADATGLAAGEEVRVVIL